jgi:hypothetical protein
MLAGVIFYPDNGQDCEKISEETWPAINDEIDGARVCVDMSQSWRAFRDVK